MAVYNTPGIYIDEIIPEIAPVLSAGTGVTAFLGFTERGPVQTPIRISSFADYQAVFGAQREGENLDYALRGFFDNGGSEAYVVRLTAYDVNTKVLGGNAASLVFEDASPAPVFTISAAYKGVDSTGLKGNDLQISLALDPRADLSAANSLPQGGTQGASSVVVSSSTGFQAGGVIQLVEGGTSETVVVERIDVSQNATGDYVHTLFLESALVNAYAAANATVKSMDYTISVIDGPSAAVLETWEKVSLGANSVFSAETLINDSQTGSAFIKISVADALKVPVVPNSAVALAGGTDESLTFTPQMFKGDATEGYGLEALSTNTRVNLLCAPLGSRFLNNEARIHASMLEYAKSRMDLFAILDPLAGKTPAEILSYRNDDLGLDSYWGALYYPRVKIKDPARLPQNASLFVPPCGHIAGLYARVASLPGRDGGISASPAGVGTRGRLNGLLGLERDLTNANQSILNPAGVNCLRLLPDVTGVSNGIFAFGARTLSQDLSFKYIAARRAMTYFEQTIKQRTRFAIFKKNGPDLWEEMSTVIESFLASEWAEGNIAGESTSEAFFVQIDQTTTSAADVQNGIVRGKIGISLFRPAEFIVFSFTQAQSAAGIEE